MIEKFAKIGDTALDAVYHYGLSTPGTFGWEANKGTASAVLTELENGERKVEALAAAAHRGWAGVALSYEDPIYASKPQKREARRLLALQSYDALPEDEKEKDRVVARAILNAY